MIRPAEIRGLYSRLQEIKGDTAGLVVANSIKAEMPRLWEKVRVPSEDLDCSIEHEGGSSFSVVVKWSGISVARIFRDNFKLLDLRFSVDVVNHCFLVHRYLADDFPETKKQKTAPSS